MTLYRKLRPKVGSDNQATLALPTRHENIMLMKSHGSNIIVIVLLRMQSASRQKESSKIYTSVDIDDKNTFVQVHDLALI